MCNRRLWVIGGTQESAKLALELAHVQLPCIISVTTEAARSLYPLLSSNQSLWIGKLTIEHLPAFLQNQQIAAILDASHPFAVEISRLAIAAAQEYNIPYLRYERPVATAEGERGEQEGEGERQKQMGLTAGGIERFESVEELLVSERLLGQRVLLTIGYRPLALFRSWQERAILFARILPSLTALEAALEAGFTSDRLIALRPPVSGELERGLWQQWRISLVVTKASGVVGGEDIKRQVAAELGVPLVIIDRPPVSYPQSTSCVQTALQFCHQHLTPQ
jgi:precorrin-6A/cobalt-precorrin-6A reductase